MHERRIKIGKKQLSTKEKNDKLNIYLSYERRELLLWITTVYRGQYCRLRMHEKKRKNRKTVLDKIG